MKDLIGKEIPLRIDNGKGQCGGFIVLERIDSNSPDHPQFYKKVKKRETYYRCICTTCAKVQPKQRTPINRGKIRCTCHRNFYRLQWVAKNRKIEFDLSAPYIWDLLIKQDHKCALTGRPIYFNNLDDKTASLDRIDSSKGYAVGNVQWLHKNVNMCKQSLTQEEFINMCKDVVKHNEGKK